MFFSLDGNHDNVLEETEVADIKNVNSEHCMKAFFQACDRNHNGVLERTEFCRCLCVGKCRWPFEPFNVFVFNCISFLIC